MRENKLKSYTIIELLISMLIMAILSILVYMLFSSFFKQFKSFSNTEEKLLSYSLFKSTIKRDFFLSDKVVLEGREVKLFVEEEVFTRYLMGNGLVLKYNDFNQTIDTFFLEIKGLDPVYIRKVEDKIISKINLNVGLFNSETKMILTKRYGKNIHINNYFKDEN